MAKYISDIIKSNKLVDKSDPNNHVDYHEISVNVADAREVWLSVAAPDVKNAENRTQLQVIIKDNKSTKTLMLVGAALITAGQVLPVFNATLIVDQTIIFRAADPISVWYTSKLDD